MGSGEQVDHRTTLQVVRKNGEKNSVPEKDFDRFMEAHLAFADSLVTGIGGLGVTIGSFSLQGISLCGVLAVLLNLVLPREQVVEQA